MTVSRRAVRLGAALAALALIAGLFVPGPAALRVKAAASAVPCIVDGAAQDAQDAPAQSDGENRLDAAERTVALRLRQDVPPAERRAGDLRADVIPRTRTTERSQPSSAEEPG